MFEFHGWATIRFTPENRDIEGEGALQDSTMEAVRDFIRARELDQWGNALIDLRGRNGATQLTVAGCNNHANISPELLGLYRYIAQVAPGSYGILYTYDDEDFAGNFRIYVLARGAFRERTDPFLSPFVPVVEDPYRDN